jgi:hypothetical protein
LLLLLLLMDLRCLDLWELHWHGGSCGAAALMWAPASLLLLQSACAVLLALQAWKRKVESFCELQTFQCRHCTLSSMAEHLRATTEKQQTKQHGHNLHTAASTAWYRICETRSS